MPAVDPHAATPSGAALAPVAAGYGSWLGLDQAAVLADRDDDPEDVRALQIVVRMERDRPPSWHAAVTMAARGCAALCLDPRGEPGGPWFDAIHDYAAGHIRKVTRRARASHWDAIADLPGIDLADGDTQIRVLVPGLVTDLDKRVSRLQVGGTDVPRDASPIEHPEPLSLVPRLRVWLNPAAPMSLGKAMAQAGHAGMIAAALLSSGAPDALGRWWRRGLPCTARVLAPGAFDELCASVTADPAGMWRDKALLAVRDAGFTEVAPGTVTAIALAPRGE